MEPATNEQVHVCGMYHMGTQLTPLIWIYQLAFQYNTSMRYPLPGEGAFAYLDGLEVSYMVSNPSCNPLTMVASPL